MPESPWYVLHVVANHEKRVAEHLNVRSVENYLPLFKQDPGYKMVNSNTRLRQMVDFMKGNHFPWNCRAGQNSLIIRVDGTLAPCFPMYSAKYDWGVVDDHKFDTRQLDEQKQTCQTHCFSTLNHILGWCYNDQGVIKYFFKQLAHGFQGMKGQM